MKAADRAIFLGVGVVLLAAAFYFLLIAPKRDRVAELDQEVTALESQISQQEQVAAFAEQAREDFPEYYGRLVVLGKAVPEEADSASLLIQLSDIAKDAKVDFRGITLGTSAGEGGSGSSAPAATTPAAPAAPAAGTAPATSGDSGAAPAESGAPAGSADSAASAVATAAAPAPATEASAATLPIGAVVGPAGLPTLPYELSFAGGFFDIADYIGGVDDLVQMRGGEQVGAEGRLITIDGFSLKGGMPGSDPVLAANFMVTTYVTPATQGLTAGATPSGPAPAQPSTTPASTVTP